MSTFTLVPDGFASQVYVRSILEIVVEGFKNQW